LRMASASGGFAMAKYWGDEKHPDAVYAVYLRKVRYVPPAGYEGVPRYRPLDPDKQPLSSEMAGGGGATDHLQWESVKERHIKAGTLDKLVECLIGPDNVMDSRHFQVFFATYRAFSKPFEVLERLQKRYAAMEEDAGASTQALVTQNSIRSILVCWLDMYPEDFYATDDDFVILSKLVEFASKFRLVELRSKAMKLRQHFKGVKADGGLMARVSSLDQQAIKFGYENPDVVENAGERAKQFDVSMGNCVQIAEQLTYWDATLFKEVIMHQCQSSVWSRRHKLGAERYYTVKATIDQFNAVCQRVQTSVVLPECKTEFRARVITKWIEIAKELRAFKNFSSLKAVLGSLQSEPIHRLKATWALVPQKSLATFRELSAIFDSDDSGDEKRILDQEGTAKSSPLRRPQLIQNCRRTKSDVNLAECQGTVPYLGSFLTDLTMIDNATPDYTEDGLINFEKREREFEVLAKLRLLQSAARAYRMPRDAAFCAWFHYLPTMSDKECYTRSSEVERLPQSTPQPGAGAVSGGSSVSKSATIGRLFPLSSRGSGGAGGGGAPTANGGGEGSPTLLAKGLPGQTSRDSGIHSDEADGVNGNSSLRGQSLTAPSTPINSVSWKGGRSTFYHSGRAGTSSSTDFNPLLAGLPPHQRTQSGDSSASTPAHHSSPFSASFPINDNQRLRRLNEASSSSSSSSPRSSMSSSAHPTAANGIAAAAAAAAGSNFRLARVGLDDELLAAKATTESGGAANYKCIKVENGDRMSALIGRCLEKHLLTGEEPAKFCLVQLLPGGGELQLPDKCNPFYAMAPDATSPMANLLLRRRPDGNIDSGSSTVAPSARKINKMKMSNLMRWSSGYL
ncbi:rgl-1, partial [Pristionchus pacificus]|uniref:Rgl-1 n=1 Tax=Pristionchus pacificus TaxID=54126 RepID=A0A8R1YHV1_PRIPA